MKRLLLAAMLIHPAQDDGIAKEIARITEKDSVASFDAIARLMDLDPVKVRPAAEKLEAGFYKTVLLEELKARETLGDGFGRVTRWSVDAKDEAARSVLLDLANRAKSRISRDWASLDYAPAISVKAADVPTLAALQAVVREAGARLFPDESVPGAVALVGGRGPGGEFQYRNFLVRPECVGRRRQADFGAAPVEYCVLRLAAIADVQSGVVRIDRVEVIEAIDDLGRAAVVVPWRDDDPAPEAYVTVKAGNTAISIPTLPPVRVKLGPGVKKLARVRGCVVTRVPVETTRLKIDFRKRAGVADDFVEISMDRASDSSEVLLLKPRQGTAEELAKMPMELLLTATEEPKTCETRVRAFSTVSHGLVAIRGSAGVWFENMERPSLELGTVLIHRATKERRIYFELRDVVVE